MAAKLHKGITLDDRFSKAVEKMQRAIDDLDIISADFGFEEHFPVSSQLTQVAVAIEDLKHIQDRLKKLKER